MNGDSIFRTLFAAYPDGLLVADNAGSIVLANPSAASLLGYEIDDLVGLNIDVLVPDTIRPRHAAYRHAYAQKPTPRPMGTDMELVARRRDGSEVMVEIALSPLHNQGQDYVVAAIRGIGAYPRVKQALQRARYSEHLAQLGRLAVDARDPQQLLPQVTAIAAQALQVEEAVVYLLEPNRLAFRIVDAVGLPDVEGVGEVVGTLVPNRADTPPGFVLDQGLPLIVADYATERRFTLPSARWSAGRRSALAVPLADRGRVIGALVVHSNQAQRFGSDEQRFLESLANLLATSLQRAQSEEALNHAARLESVGQLTGGIAHDFNNLLTVIQGNLQVLEELPALANDDYGQQLVGAAMRASRRGAELTGKLLAFSRRQVLQPSPVDVGELLNSLADMLRRTLDQHVRIEVDVPDACPAVLADPGQLESALLNIAINARDAMPDGGLLRFSALACQSLPRLVRHELDDPSAPDDGFVAISVSDTGSGMPEAVKERAFEPFFTTKEAGRGTGLGLSTVYGFVKQSRGAVAIASTPGQGTTLSLYIPRPWDRGAPAGDEPAVGQHVPEGLNVLLVEDDAEVRAVVRNFLETLRCTVSPVSSGEQALLALPAECDAANNTAGSTASLATFDLLLTDIALGHGMRGTELARRAQARCPQLAVLLMSGFSAELLDADRDSPPAWELLRKPYSRDELAQAIARVMAMARG